MHFVTERELQTNYRKAPFTHYCLSIQERLTPEARQFLLDKKIQLVSSFEKKLINEKTRGITSLTGYHEIISAEIFEAVLLAIDKELVISQKLIDLEKKLTQAFNEETVASQQELKAENSFQLETVHLFSKNGPLLIQLKKLYGTLLLVQAQYPDYHSSLTEAKIKLIEIKKQLIGEAYEKTFNESM